MGSISLRSNSQPQGGVTSPQGPTPTGSLTPKDIELLVEELTPVVARFRAQSSPIQAPLDAMTLGTGASAEIRLATAGLGYRLRSKHTGTLYLSNTNTVAETVNISQFFPFNMLANTTLQLNAQTTVYNASGVAGLFVAARTRKSSLSLTSSFGLSPALVQISVGGGMTLATSTVPSWSGYASVTIPASTTNAPLNFTFFTVEKLAKDRDSLLGMLALQNNSVFATLTRRTVGAVLGSTANFPLYTSTTGITATINSWNSYTQYDFWNVPTDAALYQAMIANSYQVQEQTGLAVNTTGPAALVYNLPINQYITALHLTMYDGNKAPLAVGGLSNVYIKYNAGGIVPVVLPQDFTRAADFLDYGYDALGFAGYTLWDGNNTTSNVTNSDSAGWVDTYEAADPQLVADVSSSVAVPLTLSITRESVVKNVQQVMG